MSDEKKTQAEETPVKEEELNKVSGGFILDAPVGAPPKPHTPGGGRMEPC
jgi:hypothetical protein